MKRIPDLHPLRSAAFLPGSPELLPMAGRTKQPNRITLDSCGQQFRNTPGATAQHHNGLPTRVVALRDPLLWLEWVPAYRSQSAGGNCEEAPLCRGKTQRTTERFGGGGSCGFGLADNFLGLADNFLMERHKRLRKLVSRPCPARSGLDAANRALRTRGSFGDLGLR